MNLQTILDLRARNLASGSLETITDRFDSSIENAKLFCYTEEEYRKQLMFLILSYYYTDEGIEPVDYINAFGHIVKTFVRWSDWDIEVSIYKSDYKDWDDPIGGWVCEIEENFNPLDLNDKVDFLIELSETY